MVVAVLLVGAVLAITAPIRGIVLSGCPVYPSTVFRWNVDWAVPVAQAEAERAFITSYARFRAAYDPHEVSGWLWIPEWARTIAIPDRINVLLPLVLTLVCIPLLFVRRRRDPPHRQENAPPDWAYATLACATLAALIVWFIQAPAPRFVIVNVWILFAVILAWAVQEQRGGWNWKAPLIGLVLVLPLTAFVLLSFLGISGENRYHVLVVLAFAAFWIVAFGLLRAANPRLLAVLCILPALLQYGERSGGDVLSKHYAHLRSMLWINVSQSAYPTPPTTVLRQTRSGLKVYEVFRAGFETPLPNTPIFNPFLQLRTTRMKDGFRNSATFDSGHHGKESYTTNAHP